MKILSTAPSRISIFGGSTDTAPYCDEYGGIVLSLAINLRQHLTMFCSDQTEDFNNGRGGPNIIPLNGSHEFYYQILDEYGLNDMHYTKLESEFDGLLEAGLGSSASAAVALLGAINKRLNLNLTRNEIAQKAWELETQKIGLFSGKQDQWASAFGGVNVFEFNPVHPFGVKVNALSRDFIEPLLPYLVLLYTGFNRKSATIQEGLRELSGPQVEALDQIKTTAFNGIKAIIEKDFYEVGRLLQEGWEHKKESNKGVTNRDIDSIFERALSLGSLGGKLCGAGGGGFALFMVEPKNRQSFIEGMGLEEFDFDISWDGLDVRRLND